MPLLSVPLIVRNTLGVKVGITVSRSRYSWYCFSHRQLQRVRDAPKVSHYTSRCFVRPVPLIVTGKLTMFKASV